MERHLIVVLTEPVEGRDDDYNAFYNKYHVPEVASTKGVIAGQRFRLVDSGRSEGPPHPYLALYEIEGDLDEARAALAAGQDGRTPLPDSVSRSNTDWWFTAISERFENPNA